MGGLIVAILVLSLTENIFPWLNVAAILLLLVLRLFYTSEATPDRWLGPRTAMRITLLAYGFWILSYLITTAPISSLLSYDFLRVKGALLVGYLPLLLLSEVRLSPRFVYRLIWVYLSVLAIVAALGATLFLFLGLGYLGLLRGYVLHKFVEFGTGHYMPVMFLGLYRTHMTAGIQYAMASLFALCFMLREGKPKLRSWGGLVFICLLGGLILSGARTAYVALAGAFVLQFAGRKAYFGSALKVASIILVTSIVFMLSVPGALSRTESIVSFQGDSNVTTRFSLYHEAFDDFCNSPIIGIGLGRFNDMGKTYSGIRHLVYVATGGELAGESPDASQAHDSYLQFLAEGGIFGLLLVLSIWISTYRWASLIKRRFHPGTFATTLCECVQVGVILTFLSSFTGTTMMMATSPLVVFTFVGLLRNVVCSECRCQVRAIHKADSFDKASLHQSLDPAAG